MTPTFLVIGAAGFTGRHLCRHLRDRNHKVVAVNRSPAADVEQCDLLDTEALTYLLGRVRPSKIFHCAGSFSDNWDKDYKANVILTQNLLESVLVSGLGCRVFLIGSAAEYGSAFEGAANEEMPLLPNSVYGVTKAMQTALMGYYCRRFNLDIVAARTFNLFGEGCSPTLFAGGVIQQAREVVAGSKQKIKVRSLESRRDYLPISAAVRAYLRIILHGASGEVYNVGSGNPIIMSSLLQELISPYGLTMDDVEIHAETQGTRASVPVIYADLRKLNGLPAI